MIEKIKNPYIPDDYSKYDPCCEKKDDSECVPKAWLTKYTDVKLEDATLIRDDVTGAYTPQGGCVYGGYIFRAMVKEDNEPAIVQKIRISDGEIVAERSAILGHANDMFVKDDKLFVLHSSSTNIVYILNIDTLEDESATSSGATRWGMAHNDVDNLDVVGTVGSAYLSVYYADDSFMYRIKPDNQFSGLVRQGVFCDENYIGVVLDNAYGATIENEKGSRVMFYTWNGMFIKSVHIPIAEIEWADWKDEVLYFGTYEGRDANDVKSGKIYSVPLDLYPEQEVLTGRPTDVSGGLNNLQRLPEGTPVKLWQGESMDADIVLKTAETRLKVTEDGPFRYLKFEFDGANAQVFDWFPKNNGVVALRETDVTAATSDSTIRHRETRLIFDATTQTFIVDSCIIEEIKLDASENLITITKNPDGIDCNKIKSIWGII